MSGKSSDMNKTQIFTIGPKTVLIITPDGRLEAGEGLSHDEVSRELFKICSTYYGTRTAELERENAALRTVLKRWLKVADDCHREQQEVGYSEYNITAGLMVDTRALLDAARMEAQP